MRSALVIRALAVALAIGTTACGTTRVVEPSTTAPAAVASPGTASSATPTPSGPPPSVEPSPAASSGYPYPVGSLIQVVADSVRVREAGATSAEIIGGMPRDTTATVVGGPTEADGFTWFEVASPFGTGWVATGDAEDRWIVASPSFERSELAFRFGYTCDVAPPLVAPALTVTADRDVVALGPDDNAWWSGRLTPTAFDDFMVLVGHPALGASAEYRPELRPDAGDPPGHGLCVYEFTRGAPDDRVHVTSVSWFGDQEESQYYVPSPERRALDELARRLMLGFELFTDASWETPPAEYESQSHLVWIWPDAASPTTGAPSIDDLDMLGDPARFGEPIGSGRCGYLDRAEAEAMASVFAGSPSPMALSAVSYLTVSSQTGWLNVVTSPITPDGLPTCGDLPG